MHAGNYTMICQYLQFTAIILQRLKKDRVKIFGVRFGNFIGDLCLSSLIVFQQATKE